MTPIFYNKSGTLTAYAFACGYYEVKILPACGEARLFLDGCWHVTARDDLRGRYVWETFPIGQLTKARKFFRGLK